MRSRAIDRLRTRKVVERTHETAHQEDPVEHIILRRVEAVFIQREAGTRVRLEPSFPPEQRQVLEHWRFYEGLTQEDRPPHRPPARDRQDPHPAGHEETACALRAEIRELL